MAAPQIRLQRIPYDEVAWGSIVDAHPQAEVYHSPAWLRFLAVAHGAQPLTAEVRDDDRVVGHFVGAIVLRFGLRILGSPLSGWGTQVMGFLLDEGVDRRAALEALLDFAYAKLGCVHVELGDRQVHAPDAEGSRFTVTSYDSAIVDLTGTDADLLSQMSASPRYYARRAARNGLVAEVARGIDFADEYYEQLVEVFRTKGLLPTYGVERVRQLIELVEPSGQLLLVRIRTSDGARVGTNISIGRRSRAILWGAAFHREYARLNPVEPLQFESIRQWRERGARCYDMAGDSGSKARFSRSLETTYRLHHSRFAFLEHGREAMRSAFYARQRVTEVLTRRSRVTTR